MRGAPLPPSIRHHSVARILQYIRRQQSPRRRNHRLGLHAGQRPNPAKRTHPKQKTYLRLEHIAHPGHHPLIQQRIRQPILCALEQSIRCGRSIKRIRQDIFRSARNLSVSPQRLRRMDPRHRNAKSNRLVLRRTNHNARSIRRQLPRLARAIDMPASAHQHVGRKNSLLATSLPLTVMRGKCHQHPLAPRLHPLDPLSHKSRFIRRPRQLGIRALKSAHHCVRKRPVQRSRRAKYRISLGHCVLRLAQLFSDLSCAARGARDDRRRCIPRGPA